MSFQLPVCWLVFAGILLSPTVDAGCTKECSDAHAFERSRAVAEMQVLSTKTFVAPDKTLQTRTTLKLITSFKGNVPAEIELITPGGTLKDRTDFRSDSIPFKARRSYILLLDEDAAGKWIVDSHRSYRADKNKKAAHEFFRKGARGPRPLLVPSSAPDVESAQGSANGVPGSVVTTTGYMETELTGGQPTRFTTCDGEEPIPYLIDIDSAKLPTGMNQAGAVSAVAEVMNAWAASSSLKFRYEGTVSFGVGANTIGTEDRRLRIQLHDNFNSIISTGVLGIGGGSFRGTSSIFTGARVGTQGFQERLFGYVVLESTTNSTFMQNVANFKRVLTHEVGHALGLTHSSENASEPDAILKAATMYFQATANSAGATIQTYDVDRIQFGYPQTNTPPFGTDRVLQLITTSDYSKLPVELGVNRIQLRATDREGTALTASMVESAAGSGVFSLNGNTLIFTPNNNYGNQRLTDAEIEDGFAFGRATIQFSDGVNLSRAIDCIITGFSNDSFPNDGLPDTWLTTYFGNSSLGTVGSDKHPASDPDKDGLTNRVEFYLNTDPKVATSGPVKPAYNHASRQISFTPVRFAPYWVESSTSLTSNSWAMRRVGSLYQATGTLAGTFTGDSATKTFYRVAVGP